jgi:nitroreductase
VTPFKLQEIDRLLTTTRSVRKRLDLERPVPPDVIEECLRLAFYTPNALNLQIWRWMVVTEPDQRRAVGEIYYDILHPIMVKNREERLRLGDPDLIRHTDSTMYLIEHITEVPVLVIPCIEGRYDGTQPLAIVTQILGSIYPAVWSFQLALRSRGLGSTFTNAHLLAPERVAAVLGIPDGYLQTCLLPVAYTKGGDFRPAKRRSTEEVVYWNRWGEAKKPR